MPFGCFITQKFYHEGPHDTDGIALSYYYVTFCSEEHKTVMSFFGYNVKMEVNE